MSQLKIQVLKFGSSVLATSDDLDLAVQEIYRCWRQGYKVVAVVSAIGDTTDRLLQAAKQLSPRPNPEALAELLATGELESAAFLNLALCRSGIPSHVLDAVRVGIQTRGSVLDADPVALDVAPLLRRLEQCPVLVVPGFIGQHEQGSLSLLGRGGSDITALFLAQRLGAECRLLKDVAGLYEWDPSNPGLRPRLYERISYPSCLRLDGGIVQYKAVRFAQEHHLRFEVGEIAADFHTSVGEDFAESNSVATSEWDSFHSNAVTPIKLRVALLGLGTVGYGVYRHLRRHAQKFDIQSIVVANPQKVRADDVDVGLLNQSLEQAMAWQPDLVIDAIGSGVERASEFAQYLARGGVLVTADKQLLAEAGSDHVGIRAAAHHALHYSAAVAGVLPAVETVKEIARQNAVRCIEGVLNGTSNFVLQQLADGSSLQQAIAAAQELGFAEADPSADLSGLDAARKLVVLAAEAWGIEVPVADVQRIGLEDLPADTRFSREGECLRVVARAERTEQGLRMEVVPRWLPMNHVLARAVNEGNVLCIRDANSELHIVHGKGAGRWPTAEAVFADCLDAWRSCQRQGVLA